MARYVSSALGATVPTALRPALSVYSIAGVGYELREAAAFNTTATACRNALTRLTAAGTPGTGQVEGKYDPDSLAASATAFITHTADATAGDRLHVMPCGAAIGAGTILTFYDRGIEVAVGTANGIGIVLLTGTAQIIDCHMVWDE